MSSYFKVMDPERCGKPLMVGKHECMVGMDGMVEVPTKEAHRLEASPGLYKPMTEDELMAESKSRAEAEAKAKAEAAKQAKAEADARAKEAAEAEAAAKAEAKAKSEAEAKAKAEAAKNTKK